jgi:hypothetical protein
MFEKAVKLVGASALRPDEVEAIYEDDQRRSIVAEAVGALI